MKSLESARSGRACADALDQPQVACGAVPAVHRLQHPVAARLHRQMQEGHQLRLVAMRGDQVVGHVVRMRGGVADPRQSLDAREPPHQGGEAGSGRVAVGVDVLPEQRDLDHAPVDQRAGFRLDARGRPRYLAAAGIGHDAEGAELVAAFLHGEKGHGRPPGAAVGGEVIELLLGGKLGLDRPFAALAAVEHVRQAVVGLRTDHQVDHGRACQDLGALGLRHAAGDADSQIRVRDLQAPEPPELGIDLLRGLLADVAGIEQDQVGVLGGRHGLVAARYERAPPFARCHRRSSDSRKSLRRASFPPPTLPVPKKRKHAEPQAARASLAVSPAPCKRAGATSAGACGPVRSSWRAPAAWRRSSARPSDSPASAPNAPDTPRASCCRRSSDAASASSASCRPRGR